jgi:hypothetical protein
MQKVEGSSPFSRFKSPANAGFFRGGAPGSSTVTMQKVDDSNPACGCANAPICWSFSTSGVRRRDQTAIFLSRFRIRSGNASRAAGSPLHARRGSMTPHASSRTSLGPSPTGIDEVRSHEPKSAATVPTPSLVYAAAGLRTVGLLLVQGNGRLPVVGASAHAGCLRDSANPSAGGDAQTAQRESLV